MRTSNANDETKAGGAVADGLETTPMDAPVGSASHEPSQAQPEMNDVANAERASANAPGGESPDVAAAKPAASHWGRCLAWVVGALVIFALCNAAITLVYEPYGSRSQVSWSDYAQTEGLDTVIVGTSLVQHALNPKVVDRQAGTSSFNLGTPAQSLEDSFIGIQTAYEDHGVKRAILGLSRESLTAEGAPNACSPYLRFRSMYVPFGQTFSAVNQMLWHYGASKTETSINWMFPWITNHVRPSLNNFIWTANAKLTQMDVAKACEDYDPGWKYVYRGHGTRGSKLDYNSPAAYPLADGDDEGGIDGEAAEETQDVEAVAASVDEDRANTLRDICAYCNEHGIELVVMSAPLPVFNVIDPEAGYVQFKHEIESICAEHGVAYYDFNYASSDLYTSKASYFYDASHFNLKGARVFSRSFGAFLAKLNAGEDVSKLFIAEDELPQTVDYISIVLLDDTVSADGVHLRARAIAGPSVVAEYQICARESNDEEWRVVRDWSTDPQYTYPTSGHGVMHFRVNARMVGSDADYDRYREIREMY